MGCHWFVEGGGREVVVVFLCGGGGWSISNGVGFVFGGGDYGVRPSGLGCRHRFFFIIFISYFEKTENMI